MPEILKFYLFHWKTRLGNIQIHEPEAKRTGLSEGRKERVRMVLDTLGLNPSSPTDCITFDIL